MDLSSPRVLSGTESATTNGETPLLEDARGWEGLCRMRSLTVGGGSLDLKNAYYPGVSSPGHRE
jgi:hypothetical protein